MLVTCSCCGCKSTTRGEWLVRGECKNKCLFLGSSNKTLFTKTGKGLDLAHLLWALDIIDGQKENKSLVKTKVSVSVQHIKDSAVALAFSTVAHLTLEIGLKTTEPDNRRITNDTSSTQT